MERGSPNNCACVWLDCAAADNLGVDSVRCRYPANSFAHFLLAIRIDARKGLSKQTADVRDNDTFKDLEVRDISLDLYLVFYATVEGTFTARYGHKKQIERINYQPLLDGRHHGKRHMGWDV